MFEVVYLFVLAWAALPLARTLMQGGHGDHIAFVHRLYRDAAYISVAVLGIIVLEAALGISLENYWFTELGQSHRYWLSLEYRVAIFSVVTLLIGLFVGANLRALCRPYVVVPPSAPWIAGFVFAAMVGFLATALWIPLMRFLGATPAGVVDPVFGRDLSFYLLALPLYDDIVEIIIGILCGVVALWVVLGTLARGRTSALAYRPDPFGGALRPLRSVAIPSPHPGWAISVSWMRQGMVLGAMLCVALGVSRFLGRYHLVLDGHSKVVAGASYADVNFWLPGYDIIIACWFVAASILVLAAAVPRLRNWLLMRRSHWLAPLAALAVLFVGALAVPDAIEDFYVGPNQITLELPYLLRSIAGTRQAYNLEGPSVEEREFAVSSTPLTAADLTKNAATLQDARIWDWRALDPQLQQIQGLRPYYTFRGVDIDRYEIDGAERQVMITARELDVTRLPAPAQVWVNLALKYTHGYGVVAVPVNEIDSRGNPVLWAHDIPIEAKKDLSVIRGQIYFGELTDDRVYVHTTEKEFDFPQGQANAETVYQGTGGILLSNLWRKLVIAREFDGPRLFISGYFTPESRVMLRRNIVERARTLAPFLSFDHDPYIVADADHYSYIIDAYTTSENYPYSEAYQGSLPAFRGYNYLRNSVKAVIDAYNGAVTFYVFDRHDPIINAYRQLLPELFKDEREMPENLRRHIRYPEDIFTVQAEMYGTYHMTNPTTFYNREDRWEVPHELYRSSEIAMLPYYVTAQLPGSDKPEFLLMLPLAVAGKNQMAGWLAGLSDGENYGKMVAFRFSKGTFVDGPAQVESRISSDSRFSGDLTLWDQHGSQVIRGNLIVLPLVGNQLITIEPVYIEAEQTKIPMLARVVLGQLLPDDRKIEWASTLTDAERLLIGASAPTSAATGASNTGTGNEMLVRARALFGEMQREYAAGNFARYGELLQQLGKLLEPQ
ncbi:MAG: UPF0182 family protein [Xanthobacteraceae bacterium]|nr:UPF0182 family protein [Xanthobacteraceae bacterium]